MKSKSIGFLFFAITLILGLLEILVKDSILGDNLFFYCFSLVLITLSVIYDFFFYTFYGLYNSIYLQKHVPHIVIWRLNEFLFTPLFYAILAYLIDRFILIRFTEKTWLRILLLLVIFAGLSIPVLILHPPLGQ